MAILASGSPGLLGAANRRLVRTIDALSDEGWSAPSLLPGWTRAHVVAHLALNAEGLAGAVTGVVERRAVPMYDSDESRDADIDALAAEPPATVRERLFGAGTVLGDALTALTAVDPELGATLIERTPGSARRFAAADVAHMRLREVEIHHVDLDSGYSPADWSAELALTLLEEGAERMRRAGPSWAGRLVATDLDDWSATIGAGSLDGPTVSGPACGLAWWLTGRAPYPGAEVTSDDGVLPRIEAM